jgi:hypothetical protein
MAGQVGLAVRLSRGLMPLQRMRRTVSGCPEWSPLGTFRPRASKPLDGLLHRAPANPMVAGLATLMGFEAGGRSHSPGPYPVRGMGTGASMPVTPTGRMPLPGSRGQPSCLRSRCSPWYAPTVTHPCTLGHTGRRASAATRRGQTAAPKRMSTADSRAGGFTARVVLRHGTLPWRAQPPTDADLCGSARRQG